MNRTDIIQKLKQLEGISQDERAYLINLVNTKKKYGLVWEDKPEDVEEQLRTQLPVLREVIEKRILAKDLPKEFLKTESKEVTLFSENDLVTDKGIYIKTNAPNHIIIEGDNLHVLTSLTFTHEGRINVIYIDPPYNTGNKDFKYNDSFVDREDSYRHSKWLSFMQKRLLIAKRLLCDKGAIFISIDDNEQAQLKLLCDEVFGEQNFLADVIWEKADSPRMDAKFFSTRHDHTLVYVKNINSFELGNIDTSIDTTPVHYSKIDKSGRSYYLKPLRAMGKDGKREARPTMYYGITAPDGTEVFPKNQDGSDSRWRWSKDKLENELNRTEWLKTKSGWSLYFRIYADENMSKPPETIWFNKDVGSNRTSKLELTSICPDSPFDTPKPLGLIKRILKITSLGVLNPLILDFFAGSGTTLHATMQLNAEDGKNRQCFLVTNNENNICEVVTYNRNLRAITGYINSKQDWVPGLSNNNLRYYKVDFVSSTKNELNKRLLAQCSTDLLSIKEDCFIEITKESGFNPIQCKIFTNDCNKYMIVVYHSRKQLDVCEQLIAYIKTINDLSEKIKLYAFSPEKETLLEDFYEVADKIDAVPLPEAIYNAYRATFKTLKLDKITPTLMLANLEEAEYSNELFDIIQDED